MKYNYLEGIIPNIGKNKPGPAAVIARDMIQYGLYNSDHESLTDLVYVVRPDKVFFLIQSQAKGAYKVDKSQKEISVDDIMDKLTNAIIKSSVDVDIMPYNKEVHEQLESRLTLTPRTITVSSFQGRYPGDRTTFMSGNEMDIVILRYITGNNYSPD